MRTSAARWAQQRSSSVGAISSTRTKTLSDRVHDHVQLHPIVVRAMDTPEFQRLRMLKQLGSTVFIYTGATHTRFEHSIGVAHLGSQYVSSLRKHQPDLGISDSDQLCVELAGLCHDLGHGPFSHLFETVVNKMRQRQGSDAAPWHHEAMSTRLTRRIMQRLKEDGGFPAEEDINFIELLIEGLPPKEPWPTNVGRGEDKRFLTEIVANKRNGLDVDKLDYFLRDSLCCYGRPTADLQVNRLIGASRIIDFEGQPQLCYQEKVALQLADVFSLRARLHKHVYQHRVAKITDCMVSDAIEAADPHFFVKGSAGPCRISEAVDDPEAFIVLGDWILDAFAASCDPKMEPAQKVVAKLRRRELYPTVGLMPLRGSHLTAPTSVLADDLRRFVSQGCADAEERKRYDDALVIDFTNITLGSKDENNLPNDPLSNFILYNPKTRWVGRPQPGTHNPLFSPREFEERSMVVYTRDAACVPHLVAAIQRWKLVHRADLHPSVQNFNRPY